jgi:RNA polymerase sigma factor (sigma-70 family)
MGVRRYLHEIRRFAMLEREQEYELARRWRERGDRDAGNQLVTSHLRLAAKIAMGYRGYGLPVSEIISEGNIGLMQALNRFEPETNLDVSDQDVVDMNRRLGGDKSINAPLHEDGETGEWQDHLVDQSPSPEAIAVEQDDKEHQHKALIAAIDVLDDRERRIFEARHLVDEPLTLEDLAEQFNVSRERIRQIEARAFEKVRKAVKNLLSKAPAPMLEAWGT